ncbi:MAG: ORF6N domain-containing protein [Elusimicrobia bacterium]|nr:ORF6N domain-containing protein [Elusimicrobiota bacterium]
MSLERFLECPVYHIRGLRVLLDSHLARYYGVSTRNLNRQARRNIRRFPVISAFRLDPEEAQDMRRLKARRGGSRGIGLGSSPSRAP